MMRREWMTMCVVVAVAGLVGCGTGALSSSDDCYDELLSAAQSCLPPSAAMGELDDAGTTCSYSGGDQISLPPPQSDGVSNFVLNSASGALCLSYRDVDGGFRTLSTPAGTAIFTSGSVTCPGGISYTGGTPFGNISAYGSGVASFTLVTGDGGWSVFNCVSP